MSSPAEVVQFVPQGGASPARPVTKHLADPEFAAHRAALAEGLVRLATVKEYKAYLSDTPHEYGFDANPSAASYSVGPQRKMDVSLEMKTDPSGNQKLVVRAVLEGYARQGIDDVPDRHIEIPVSGMDALKVRDATELAVSKLLDPNIAASKEYHGKTWGGYQAVRSQLPSGGDGVQVVQDFIASLKESDPDLHDRLFKSTRTSMAGAREGVWYTISSNAADGSPNGDKIEIIAGPDNQFAIRGRVVVDPRDDASAVSFGRIKAGGAGPWFTADQLKDVLKDFREDLRTTYNEAHNPSRGYGR